MHNTGALARIHDVRTTHDDNVLFNCKFINRSQTLATPLDFSSNRNSEVLKSGNMYYLIVDSFDIPNKTLPIFTFSNEPSGVEDDGMGAPTVFRPLRVSVVNDNGPTVGYAAVKFFDTFAGFPVNGDRGDLEQLNNGNKIYYIGQFLKMVNNALARAASQAGIADQALRPFIQINEGDGTNLFELIIPQNADPAGDFVATNGVNMSYQLYQYFEGLEARFNSYNAVDGQDYTIIFTSNPVLANPADPPTPPLSLIQEHHSIYNWTDIQSILLLSSDLPVNEENFTNTQQNGADEKIKVIADFKPFSKEDGNIDRTNWRYNSDYPRLIDLLSNRGVINISFSITILKKDNTTQPLYIAPGDVATLKMRFVKRALYNNEYNLADLSDRINQIGLLNKHRR